MCGNGCDGQCGGGQCVNNCDNFQDQCGDSCTNTDNDPLNCGDCGQECDADELCANGQCRRYSLADCNQCPCDSCDGRCCDSEFIGAAVCISGNECP